MPEKKPEYKEHCGFRNKINVCSFKAEDCSPEKCDMYNIEWNRKSLETEFKKIKKRLKEIQEEIKSMKKSGEKKTDPDKYKALKVERFDLVKGGIYLGKAFERVKREGRR